MNSIPIGQSVQLTQNIVYATSAVSVSIQSNAQLQSSILATGPFTNFSGLVTGNFIRCATGNATIMVSQN